jgi:hypothetical protein
VFKQLNQERPSHCVKSFREDVDLDEDTGALAPMQELGCFLDNTKVVV